MFFRSPYLTFLTIILLTGFTQLLPEYLQKYLRFDREAISAGQYWRLLSAHFLHTNIPHLLMNIAALTMFWHLFKSYLQTIRTLGLLLLLSLLSSIAIFIFSPHLYYFMGLSGLLHGLIVWGSVKDIVRGEPFGAALLFGVVTKIAWEQLGGDTSGTAALINAAVAIDTHLWGATIGLLIAVISTLLRPLNLWGLRPTARF